MSELRTDEEQAEMLKQWWSENGTSLLVSVVLVVGGWLGWNQYQQMEQQKGEAASALFSSLTEKFSEYSQNPGNEVLQAEAVVMAETLKKEFSGSTYGQFGSLFLARFAAENKDIDSAVKELKALTAEAQPPVLYLVRVRLANLLIDQDKTAEALALVSSIDDPAYAPQYLETRGDALFRKGDKSAARAAYLEAIEAATGLGMDTRSVKRKADFLVASEGAE